MWMCGVLVLASDQNSQVPLCPWLRTAIRNLHRQLWTMYEIVGFVGLFLEIDGINYMETRRLLDITIVVEWWHDILPALSSLHSFLDVFSLTPVCKDRSFVFFWHFPSQNTMTINFISCHCVFFLKGPALILDAVFWSPHEMIHALGVGRIFLQKKMDTNVWTYLNLHFFALRLFLQAEWTDFSYQNWGAGTGPV